MSAITNINYTKSIEIKPLSRLKAFDRQSFVSSQVGRKNLQRFEIWAFHYQNGMIYDERVPFLWSCAHSKCPVSDRVDVAIQQILAIWKDHEDESL